MNNELIERIDETNTAVSEILNENLADVKVTAAFFIYLETLLQDCKDALTEKREDEDQENHIKDFDYVMNHEELKCQLKVYRYARNRILSTPQLSGIGIRELLKAIDND